MVGFVDVHAHVVPSGDDGADEIEDGLALCRMAYEAGTEVLFATPHAHAPWDTYPRTPERDSLYAAVLPVMQREVAAWGLDLRRGWEVYPTEVAPEDVEAYALEGTRGVLIEFPGFWVELDNTIEIISEAGRIVEDAGLVPVLAHPERCRAVSDEPACVAPFVERGWLLCVNAPSFLGKHGANAERTAWKLLDAGYVALAASDGHTPSRPPTLNDSYAVLCKQRGEAVARPLFTGTALPWS